MSEKEKLINKVIAVSVVVILLVSILLLLIGGKLIESETIHFSSTGNLWRIEADGNSEMIGRLGFKNPWQNERIFDLEVMNSDTVEECSLDYRINDRYVLRVEIGGRVSFERDEQKTLRFLTQYPKGMKFTPCKASQLVVEEPLSLFSVSDVIWQHDIGKKTLEERLSSMISDYYADRGISVVANINIRFINLWYWPKSK
jgi:hypothetical protein